MNPLLILLVFLTSILGSGIAWSAPTVSQTSADIQAVAHDISQLKDKLVALNKERSGNEKKLLEEERKISRLQADIRAVESRIMDGENAVKQLKIRQRDLLMKKQEEKARIAKSLRSMYLTSGDDRIKQFLNQEDPEQISRQLVYLEYLQKAQYKALKRFELILVELSSNQKKQEALSQSLVTRKKQLQAKQQALTEQSEERAQLIKRLATQYQQGGKALSALEKQQKALETVLATIKSRELSSDTPFNRMKGKLPWPLKGQLLSGYNDRRSETKLRWQGLLIGATAGQPVSAVHDGRVIFSDWLRGYGQLVIVDHGNDYLTLYAHNESLLKDEGEVALAGEPLALVGQTGGQSQPALYFEIRHKGTPLNPSQWLAK